MKKVMMEMRREGMRMGMDEREREGKGIEERGRREERRMGDRFPSVKCCCCCNPALAQQHR